MNEFRLAHAQVYKSPPNIIRSLYLRVKFKNFSVFEDKNFTVSKINLF